MSQYAVELCTLLVEENFGELFGRIFSTLAQYGRLSILQLKDYSELSRTQLECGLSAMIQMHLVYHHTKGEITYYEANVKDAYYLVRSGKILNAVEDRLGSYAARIMFTILSLGHVQVQYLESLPVAELEPSLHVNGINGHTTDVPSEYEESRPSAHVAARTNGDYHTDKSLSRLRRTLRDLAMRGYIHRVREAHFQSDKDNQIDAEKIAEGLVPKELKGKRKAEWLEAAIGERLRRLTNSDIFPQLPSFDSLRSRKRPYVNGNTNSRKRLRLDSSVYDDKDDGEDEQDDVSVEEFEDDDSLEPGLVVRVNYQKLDVLLRTDRLIKLAEEGNHGLTAQIFGCLLRRIEHETPQCREMTEIPREGEEPERETNPVPLHDLAHDIGPSLDLAAPIGPIDPSDLSDWRGNRALETGVNGTDSPHDGAANVKDVQAHLALLGRPPLELTTPQPLSGNRGWTVKFRHLAKKLRHRELERIVGTRYGSNALRIIRALHAKGRLDEKRLQEICLLPTKELRQKLADLQTGGFVDLQEVPRDSQRQPSRTIYLWFYDPDRIGRNLLHDTYKAMSRCLQRLHVERKPLQTLLDKAQRTDVIENELLNIELTAMRQWEDKEALLLGEVARLDDLVAIFRDF